VYVYTGLLLVNSRGMRVGPWMEDEDLLEAARAKAAKKEAAKVGLDFNE